MVSAKKTNDLFEDYGRNILSEQQLFSIYRKMGIASFPFFTCEKPPGLPGYIHFVNKKFHDIVMLTQSGKQLIDMVKIALKNYDIPQQIISKKDTKVFFCIDFSTNPFGMLRDLKSIFFTDIAEDNNFINPYIGNNMLKNDLPTTESYGVKYWTPSFIEDIHKPEQIIIGKNVVVSREIKKGLVSCLNLVMTEIR